VELCLQTTRSRPSCPVDRCRQRLYEISFNVGIGKLAVRCLSCLCGYGAFFYGESISTARGGMSWLRSTPSVIEFVLALLEKCGCLPTLSCSCHCDDQVALNRLLCHDYKVVDWDQPIRLPTSEDDMAWEGQTGMCNRTGHKGKKMAESCEKNWVAIPQTWKIMSYGTDGEKHAEGYDNSQ
jgi:hypothetical protein